MLELAPQSRAPLPGSCPPGFDLVIFDLDGTLVDTAPDIADTVNDVLRRQGRREVPQERIREWIGYGTRELLRQAWAGSGAEAPIALDELVHEFEAAFPLRCGRRGRLYPDALATLDSLREAGVALALLTNKEQRFADVVLRAFGLEGCFDVVVYGDSLAARKPDALPVHHCVRRLGVSADRVLVVGDSDIDVQTARNAFVPVWAVSYGYNRGMPIEQSRPDRILQGLAELLP
ncbi:MAG TPA: phosphoglycolate phosphatase [Candidatus Binatia bacterium]|nr:phosphoglycolate phosphatase [Candidatus Binatia bacterium]